MAPERPRASSNSNPRINSSNSSKQTPKQQRARRGSAQVVPSPSPAQTRSAKVAVRTDDVPTTRTPEPTGDVGMSPADRYYKNLRVLRRRDPHIVSIFDQFAHVTVYYMQDDLNMERAGYEGTLFFFERDIDPKYGLFILNRQGMNDYIRYLLHDDVFEPMGDAVWISTLMPTSPNAMGDEDKTAGFWAMAMDVRETLGDMMMRLAPYIRRGERYPDKFRYGPDRVVPQQNYFAGGTRDDVKHDFLRDLPDGMREKIIKTVQNAKAKAQADEEAGVGNGTTSPGALPPAQSNMSDLDQLFSKLAAADSPAPEPTLLAPPETLCGKALLDTLFASVSTPTVKLNGSGQKLTLEQLGLAPAASSPQIMEILSPRPSAAGLPQILTTGVIDELMGLPSSDSRSGSRSSTSASALEYPRSPSSAGAGRSRERGYIADFGEDDGGTSEASTSFEADNSTGTSILERLLPSTRLSFLNASSAGSTGSLKGDATPRARLEQLEQSSPPARSRPVTSKASVSETSMQSLGIGAAPPTNQKSVGTNQPAVNSRTVSAPSTVRVPFQSGADIWPGVEKGVSSVSATTPNGVQRAGFDEVVELDFSEIAALDDIHAIEARNSSNTSTVHGREGKGKANGAMNGVTTMPNGIHPKSTVSSTASMKQGTIASPTKGEKNGTMTAGPKIASVPAQAVDLTQNIVGTSLRAGLIGSKLIDPEGEALSRNAFVREVLTLIHTDKSFVDRMYETYKGSISRAK